jgi:hypothetical protein
MTGDLDLELKALLAAPERPADEAFTTRVAALVEAEQRLARATRRAWARFAAEMLAATAALTAFYLLSRLAPAAEDGIISPFGPAGAALLLLVLWVAVAGRGVPREA